MIRLILKWMAWVITPMALAIFIGNSSFGLSIFLIWVSYVAMQIGAIVVIASFVGRKIKRAVRDEKEWEQDRFFELLEKSENKRAVLNAYLKSGSKSVPIRMAGSKWRM